MSKRILVIVLFIFGFRVIYTSAQTITASSNLVAEPIPDRTVSFSVSDTGVSKPIIWGLDLAWLDEGNIRRGVAFMGANRVDIVRSSFTPTAPLVNGELQAEELGRLNQRLTIINTWLGSNTQVVLNCDHPTVDPWFKGNAKNWAQLIDITTKLHQEAGRTVITVSPFNEPDYSATGQGNITDFYNIAGELKQNSRFNSIRISGGNTLNCDQALPWYNTLKARLDEGNTHQLAGSFDNYASFYQTVRANGDHATNDELHNVMEAMVGVEYGMQTGIWWGTAELARGEFVKASDGVRLGYAEHRPNWTAASVYRGTDGKVKAFGGTSERQAATTTYRFVSKDRDVFYDGYGPQREYTMVMPGGVGYQDGQTNAERVVNITWGDDIQPVIDGKYILVNRNSGKVLETANSSASAGSNLQQGTNIGETYQQWNVTPVDSRIGGDFSYFTLTSVKSGKSPDVTNYSLDNGGNIIVWEDTKSSNQQWYLEYSKDGWFFIRNRNSSMCIDVEVGSTAEGANIQQSERRGGASQQWRFIPIDAEVEFVAPNAPTDLVAKPNAESIQLEWVASAEVDVKSYTVFRSETVGGPYTTIARNVTTTSFLDNSATSNVSYYYVIKAVDNSLNRSSFSAEVSSASTGNKSLLAYYPFNGNLQDTSINLNHSVSSGGVSFGDSKVGSNSLVFNGTDAYVKLPTTIANQEELTISTWVYWKGGSPWQRIFDFGNGEAESMSLTPSTGLVGGKLQFSIQNGDVSQDLQAPVLPFKEWAHVIITLKANEARMYVNGELVDESDVFSLSPDDFKPALNYLGRSQIATDALFNGNIDEFVMYNYAISAEKAEELYTLGVLLTGIDNNLNLTGNDLLLWPIPANNELNINYTKENSIDKAEIKIYSLTGSLVLYKQIGSMNNNKIDVSKVPSGVYMLNINSGESTKVKKIIIQH